jgi:hypothetical protein
MRRNAKLEVSSQRIAYAENASVRKTMVSVEALGNHLAWTIPTSENLFSVQYVQDVVAASATTPYSLSSTCGAKQTNVCGLVERNEPYDENLTKETSASSFLRPAILPLSPASGPLPISMPVTNRRTLLRLKAGHALSTTPYGRSTWIVDEFEAAANPK